MPVTYLPIPHFPGYRVGSDSSVWSRRKMGRRLVGATADPGAAIAWRRLKTPPLKNGYLSVALRRDGKVHTLLLHRLVLEVFVGPCPPGLEACHHPDRTKTNCAANNLRWDSRQANATDQLKHGTRQRGERNGHAKLTATEIESARLEYAKGGTTIKALATARKCSRQALGQAISGRTWKHLATT